MSNQDVVDFLTKQLFIERNIVTYRSLSREFGLHVNVAKNELATFYNNGPYLSHPVQSFATYLVTGEIHTASKGSLTSSQEDDDDDDNPYLDYEDAGKIGDGVVELGDSEEVTQIQVTLVDEDQLETVKARYKRLYSVHIYSLTPSPLRESALICSVTDNVREVDSKQGAEMAAVVGRVIEPTIKHKTTLAPPVAGPSKQRHAVKTKQEEEKSKLPQVAKQEKPKEEAKLPEKAQEKRKATGKLDFFKPKPKETKKAETSKAEIKDQPAPRTFFNVNKKNNEQTDVGPHRGTKRKSTADTLNSNSEDDTGLKADSERELVTLSKRSANNKSLDFGKRDLAPVTELEIRIKNGVILSDGEEEVPRVPRRKVKTLGSTMRDADTEGENAARALMDIDDEHVARASHPVSAPPIKATDMEQDVDIPMAEVDVAETGDVEVAPKSKPKQRKPRRTVPVGSNGLKKKRVIKSRTTVDEKGYMATEDYSSYESVEEEEPKTFQSKGRRKGTAKILESKENGDKDDGDAIPPLAVRAESKIKNPSTKSAKSSRPTAKSTKGGQASLVNFFGPPKAKR
ncbi:hypothetical protein AX17_002738 [Amanita inopinata Kibby_2008]|nr:hypothetical protein AX17_002738 [Amanita inopinata Kibby_2008]